MEVIVSIVSFLLVAALILSPIAILWIVNKLNVKFKFITYLIVSILVTVFIVLAFVWWADTSDKLLLRHYGYNIEGMSETEFYGNVSSDNIDRVKMLEKSIMGIGWPLKAIITFVFYSPYLLIVYFISYVIRKSRSKA